jgi:hypothetical protein
MSHDHNFLHLSRQALVDNFLIKPNYQRQKIATPYDDGGGAMVPGS